MRILMIPGTLKEVGEVVFAIRNKLPLSRFIAELEVVGKKQLIISIGKIRLRKSKPYCGNHPAECLLQGGREPKHPKTCHLEGADWVAWNDMINDVLDERKVFANFWSMATSFNSKTAFRLRSGWHRRVKYPMAFNGFQNEWDIKNEEGCFENRIGIVSGRSEFPEGTPGIPEWELNKA